MEARRSLDGFIISDPDKKGKAKAVFIFWPPGSYTFHRTNALGVLRVKGNMEERAVRLAQYIIENRATVRAAAVKFGISKSTVHKDLSERLPTFNRPLYLQAKQVLEENKAQRHIRGGIATRKKYKGD